MADAVKGQSKKLRDKVQKARDRQHERFQGTNISSNAAIPAGETFEYCKFSNEAMEQFTTVVDVNKVSTRSVNRLAKVARTIADLNGKQEIESPHVAEAVTFVVGGRLRDLF